MKFLNKLNQSDSLLAFLILEMIAIVSFTLGGNNIIFFVIGILVGIFSVLVVCTRFSKNELPSLLTFLGIMFLLSIFVSFGNLFREYYGALDLIVLLAINLFLFNGIAARRIKQFKSETLLLTIGFSIAILVLISMVFTWSQYGFFYAIRFKGLRYFYYGSTYDISAEGYWLTGFKFKETFLSYSGIYATLLTSYLFGLFFISPKKEETKRTFYLFLAIGLVGLIYLITIPYIKALIILIPALLVTLYFKFLSQKPKAGKIVKYVLIALASLAVIFFIILIFIATNSSLETAFKNNALLNRLFIANGIVNGPFEVLKAVLNGSNFLGLLPSWANEEAVNINSKMFEIELIKESGILALVLLLVFIVFVAFVIAKYLRTSKDNDYSKIILVSLIITFFIYMSFNYSSFPFSHENSIRYGETWDFARYNSFFRNPLTLIMLFLIGYVYVPLFIKDNEEYGKEIVIQEEIKNKKDNRDDDYSFEEVSSNEE